MPTKITITSMAKRLQDAGRTEEQAVDAILASIETQAATSTETVGDYVLVGLNVVGDIDIPGTEIDDVITDALEDMDGADIERIAKLVGSLARIKAKGKVKRLVHKVYEGAQTAPVLDRAGLQKAMKRRALGKTLDGARRGRPGRGGPRNQRDIPSET